MLKGLKNFLMAGNVIDLAVGFVMGAAFEKVVHSFVGKALMPLISYVLPSGVNFADYKIVLREGEHAASAEHVAGPIEHATETAAGHAGAAAHGASEIGLMHAGDQIAIGWGQILQDMLEFGLIGAAIYFALTALGKKPEPPELKKGDELLAEIRDLLAKQVGGGEARH